MPNRHRLTEWVRFSLLHCFVLRVERTRLKLQTQQHETNNFMGQIWLLQREYWSKLFLSGSCHNGYRCLVQGRQRMHQHCTLFWSHALTARKDPGLAPGLGGQGQGHSNHLTRWQYGFGDPIAEYLSFKVQIFAQPTIYDLEFPNKIEINLYNCVPYGTLNSSSHRSEPSA